MLVYDIFYGMSCDSSSPHEYEHNKVFSTNEEELHDYEHFNAIVSNSYI